jgi:hypothetical protein
MARFAPVAADMGTYVRVPPPTGLCDNTADGQVTEVNLLHRDPGELKRLVGATEAFGSSRHHESILTRTACVVNSLGLATKLYEAMRRADAGAHRETDVGHHELDRLRGIALSLPGVNERLSHGEPCFFVRDRRPLCYFHDDHNGDGRISIWCPTLPELQEEMITIEPERFFKPPTSARGVFSSWLGIYLDLPRSRRVDWTEIGTLLEEAFRIVAPKKLVAELDAR